MFFPNPRQGWAPSSPAPLPLVSPGSPISDSRDRRRNSQFTGPQATGTGRVWCLERITVSGRVSGEDIGPLEKSWASLGFLGGVNEWELLGRTGDRSPGNLERNLSVSERKEGGEL